MIFLLMETMTRIAPSPYTDRLRQALAALAALVDQTNQELLHVDSDLQQRMLQAVQDTQAAKQTVDNLKQALEEAERKARIQVTEELRAQFDQEISAAVEKVRTELYEEREELRRAMQRLTQAGAARDEERAQLLAERDRAIRELDETKREQFQALSDTEQAAAIALERQIASAIDRARSELNAEADSLRREIANLTQGSVQWNAERAELTVELERTKQLLSESEAEHSRILSETRKTAASTFERQMDRVRTELTEECDRLRLELEQLARSAAQWNTERARLTEECDRANRLLAETKSELDRARTGQGAAVVSAGPAGSEAAQAEIARVESLIRAITQLIDDPATELSVVFRKNAERAELDSYLRGIRFSVSGR
jgi:chromosome segregation ATPase